MSGSIGGVDASIPLKAVAPTPPNPLAMIGQFANAQNALNQAKAFPGQMELQRQAIQGGQTDLATKINQAAYGNLVPLLALPPGAITHDNLTTALASVERNLGLPTHGVLQHITDALPGGDGPEFDARMRSLIAAGAQPYASAAGQVTAHPGPTIDTGQQIQPTTVAPPGSPTPGQITPAGGSYDKVLSPSELATQVNRPATADEATRLGIPQGTPLTETLLQRLQSQNAPAALTGRLGVVSGANGPVGPQNPPRLTAAPSPPTPSPTGPRPIVSGMAPGAPSEIEASTGQYNAASAAANTYRQRVFPLQQAATALRNTDTGPGTEAVNHIKSFLLAQSPDSLKKYLPGVDPEKIANYDEAVKYLASYASNQPAAAGSNDRLALAQTANASAHISNEAAQRVVQSALGLENMQQAAIQLFGEQHPEQGRGALFNNFMRQFAATHDPRGFSWDNQSAAQQQASLKSMSAADKRRLLESVSLARKYGMTGAPGG